MMIQIKITKFRLLSIIAPLVLLTTAKSQLFEKGPSIPEYYKASVIPKWQDDLVSREPIYADPRVIMKLPESWQIQGFEVIRNATDFIRVFGKQPEKQINFVQYIFVLVRTGPIFGSTITITYPTIKTTTLEGRTILNITCRIDYAPWKIKGISSWELIGIPYSNNIGFGTEHQTHKYDDVRVTFEKRELVR